MDALVPHRFRFEGFTLDTKNRGLRSANREIDLRPKSFDVLCYLVEHHGELVTKDQIIDAVWGNLSTTDESLTRCISDIRAALADGQRQIIKTVPSRGYLLAVPVLQEAAHTQCMTAEPATNRDRRPARVAAAGLGVLAIAALAAWGTAELVRAPAGPPLPARPSIAVMPFQNLGGGDASHLSDGIPKSITTGLSRFGELFVISDNSAAKLTSRNAEPARIGRQLGVRYLLMGSLQRYPGRVRISVQLVDAARGRQVWSERYDRPTALIIHAEEDITQKVIGTLVARIQQSEYRRIARKPAANWSAYDFYLRGNAIMRNAPKDRTGAIVAAARQAYEHSLAFDAKYAPALQGLALTYWTAWLKPLKDARLRGEFRNPQALERSEQLARDAIDADPTRAEAWAALGWIQYWRHGPRAGLAAYERAFALNPNLVDGRYALLLAHAGRTQEATFYMKRAMRYDPLYPLRYEYYLGLSYYLAGRSSDALTPLGKAARGLRGFPTGYPVLAAAAASAGNMEAARNASSQVRRLWPKFSTARFVRFMRLERKQDASRLAAALKKAGLPE